MTMRPRVTPGDRLRALRRTVADRGYARLIEAHSGLSGIIGSNARAVFNGEEREFDGLWESSLTDSASKGQPDASIVGVDSRLHTVNEILAVTTKPLIVDGDTGGDVAQFEHLVIQLERLGVSGVIIEDKTYPKRNSLDPGASQELEEAGVFAAKLSAGRAASLSDDFLVVARLESLIAGIGLDDALERAELYAKAGAQGIMIHSSRPEPADLFEFAREYEGICRGLGFRPLLISVPTTYNQHRDGELVDLGFNIIIHANHLLRASHRAMSATAAKILASDRSAEVDEDIASVSEVFASVGFDSLVKADTAKSRTMRTPVIIPAAGQDPVFSDTPKSLIEINSRPVLDYQLEATRKAGVQQVIVVRGFDAAAFDKRYASEPNVTFVDCLDFAEHHSLHSLMQTRDVLSEGFALVFSDIIFDADLLSQLMGTDRDILLAIDDSYAYHKHEVDKRLDLVVSRRQFAPQLRSLRQEPISELVRIGKDIGIEQADFEFIGMAYFSPEGARALCEVYDDCAAKAPAPFHESPSFEQASICDIIQELIDRGFQAHGLKVNKGWMEIHNHEDVQRATDEISAMRRPA